MFVALTVLVGLAGTVLPASTPQADAAVSRVAAWPDGWINPVTGTPGGSATIFTNFGAYNLGCANADRTHEYTWYFSSGYQAHLGLDIGRAAGQPVYSVGPGQVIYSGQKWGASNGYVVLVQHATIDGTPFVATYGHLASPVGNGATVTAGQRIGTVINPGGGAHLHLGLRAGTGITEQPTIADARVTGRTCSLAKNSTGMVDAIGYLTPRQRAGGAIWLQSIANGKYVSAELGNTAGAYGMLRARATGVAAWEKFRINGDCRSNLGCAVVSVGNGLFVSTELGYSGAWNGVLRARAGGIAAWERFRLSGDCADGCAILSIANGRYVSAELGYAPAENGMLRARATSVDAWERFKTGPTS